MGGFFSVERVPSPKNQVRKLGLLSDWSANLTVIGGVPRVLSAKITAIGFFTVGGCRPLTVMKSLWTSMSEPAALVTTSLKAYLPAAAQV